jgi:hypothetical protein
MRISAVSAHPLEAIDWRLERANKHLAALDRERKRFLARLDEKDPRFVGEFDRDTSEYVFRLNCKPPNPRLGLIVGEFAHHLRDALDNLVWQLVLLRGGSPTRGTQFPIYESWERYQSSLWMLRGVSADDRALIESVQPFQHGENAPKAYLSLLAWLNNVDKHRFVHITGAFPSTVGITVSYGSEGEYAGQFPWHARFVKDVRKILGVSYVPTITSDDRAELMRVLIEPCGSDPEMKMKGDEPVEIFLSDAKHTFILTDLGWMRQNVGHVIESFRPRFDI